MSRSKRALYGTLTSFVQYGVQIGLQLFLAPLLLRVAGQETLGAYAAISQVVGYLALLDLGFSFSLGRFAEQAFGYVDSESRMYEVLTTGRSLLLGSSIVFALLTILFSPHVGSLLQLSQSVEQQAIVALQILSAWAVLRVPIKIYGIGLIAVQELATRNGIRAVSTAIRLLLSILLVWLGLGLIGLMVATIVAEGSDLIICWQRFTRKHSMFRVGWGVPNRDLFYEFLKFTFPVLLMSLATRLIYSTDTFIAGMLYGAAVASVYYSTQMPSLVVWNVILRIADNATPAMNDLQARHQLEQLRSAFLKLYRYTLMFAFPIALGVILLNKTLISLWVGPSQYAGSTMTSALAIFVIIVSISHLNESILIIKGDIRKYGFIRIVEGIVNLMLSLLLAHLIGIQGIMWATVIASLPAFVYAQISTMGKLKLSWAQITCGSIFPVARVSLLSGFAVTLFLLIIGWPTSILGLIFTSGIYAILYSIVLWFWGLTDPERNITGKYAKKSFKQSMALFQSYH